MDTVITEEQSSSSHSEKRIFGSPQKKKQVLALLLFALTLIVYNPLTHSQFVNYDDPEYVTENAHVQQGLHWRTVGWAFKTFEFFNWHPLTWISYLTNYQLFKLNPTGYHLMNILFHGLNVVLLFLVLFRFTGYLWRSLCVALLFAFHPFNVESIAWVSELKNVLSTVFWWLAIWAYGWYALKPGWKRYLTVMVLFALGLMAKPMVITLPCVLLLLDLWPFRRIQSWQTAPAGLAAELNFSRKSWLGLVWEKVPLFVLSGFSGALTIVAQRVNGGMGDTIDYPIAIRLKNAIVSYALYLYKTFWPVHFSIYYPHPGDSIPLSKIVVCSLLLAGITLWALHKRHARPYLLVGWLWFLGTLVPTSGLFQNGDQAMADRYAYIPLIGVFLMMIWELAEWTGKNHVLRWGTVSLGVVVLVFLIVDTRRQLQYWQDSASLFTHAISVTQHNDVAEMNLAVALADEGREQEAASHFHNALLYNPYNIAHRYNYGRTFLVKGDNDKAIQQFSLALEIYELDTRHHRPDDKDILFRIQHNLGVALFREGKKDEAYQHFAIAAKLQPDSYVPPLMMGMVDIDRNQLDAAYQEISESLRRAPSDLGYAGLGLILQHQSRFAEAKKAFEKALELNPDSRLIQMDAAAIENKLNAQESIQPKVPVGH